MINNNIVLEVCVNGRPVREYLHEGRAFIEARFGTEYSLRVKNDNSYRIMVVASVDGVDVVTGKPATKDGNGYVINAWSSIDIKGFRNSMENVGAFKFTKKKKSYAKQASGSTQNAGVISLVAFMEKIPEYKPTYIWYSQPVVWQNDWHSSPNWTVCTNSLNAGSVTSTATFSAKNESYFRDQIRCCSTKDESKPLTRGGAGGQSARIPEFKAGTTWGTKLEDRVVNTSFEKQSNVPIAEFNFYYDIKESLEKIGVKTVQEKQIAVPNGFPQGFATPPAGWQT